MKNSKMKCSTVNFLEYTYVYMFAIKDLNVFYVFFIVKIAIVNNKKSKFSNSMVIVVNS